jgi:pimeloyl-ACP methyl ester carboxylesterase
MTTSRIRPFDLLQRPDGRIAYDVTGSGPLVICVPGMGDLRSSFRFLVPVLVEAGYRVTTMDLRGHGDSDATFTRYDDVATGQDVLALVAHLNGPAVLVGSSMGAGAVTWAAAEQPKAARALVLSGPFVRDVPTGRATTLMLRLALLRPWGRAAWTAYYRRLFPGRAPDDLDAHRAAISASLRRPGHWKAFVQTTHTTHAPVEARLGEVTAPALVVMGERDPDFPDASAEATLVGERLRAEVHVVPRAGHYPHAEYPDVVGPLVTGFLRRIATRA